MVAPPASPESARRLAVKTARKAAARAERANTLYWCVHCAVRVPQTHEVACPQAEPDAGLAPCKAGCFFLVADYPGVVAAQEDIAARGAVALKAAQDARDVANAALGAGDAAAEAARKAAAAALGDVSAQSLAREEAARLAREEAEAGVSAKRQRGDLGEKLPGSEKAALALLGAQVQALWEVSALDVSLPALWAQASIRLGVIFKDLVIGVTSLVNLQAEGDVDAMMAFVSELPGAGGVTGVTAQDPGGAAVWRAVPPFDMSSVSRAASGLHRLLSGTSGPSVGTGPAGAGSGAGAVGSTAPSRDHETMVDVTLGDPDMSSKSTGHVQERQTGVGSSMVKAKFVKTNLRPWGVRVNYNIAVGTNGVECDSLTQLLADRMGLPLVIVRDTVFRAEVTQYVSVILGGRPLSAMAVLDLLSGGAPQLIHYINPDLPRTSATVLGAWRRMVRAQEIMFTNLDRICVALREINGELEGALAVAPDRGLDTIIDTWTRAANMWRLRYVVSLESSLGVVSNLVTVWHEERSRAAAVAAVSERPVGLTVGVSTPATAIHGGFTLAPAAARPQASGGATRAPQGAAGSAPTRAPQGAAGSAPSRDERWNKPCHSWVNTGSCTYVGPSPCKFLHE